MATNIRVHLTRISAALIAGLIAFAVLWQLNSERFNLRKAEVEQLLDGYQQRLSSEFSRALISVEVLSGLAPNGPNTPEYFERISASLYQQLDGVLSLQLAPGGVVTYLYPASPDSGVLGNNLLRNPVTQASAELAISTKQIVVDGPRSLQQGGLGIVARQPIFIEQSFWGFATAVFRLNDLLDNMDFSELSRAGYQLAIVVERPDSSPFPVLNGNLDTNPISSTTLRLANLHWVLSIHSEKNSWIGEIRPLEVLIAALFVALVAAQAGTTVQLVSHRGLLNSIIDARTRDLRQREVELNQAQHVAKVGSWYMNQGDLVRRLSPQAMRVLSINDNKQNIAGYQSQVLPQFREAYYSFLQSSQNNTIEYKVNTSAGERVMREVMHNDNGQLVGTIQDISESQMQLELIWQQSHFDQLTGLPNKQYACELVQNYYNASSPSSLIIALIDIRHFKAVNDGLGQKVGDELLVAVTGRLQSAFPDAVVLGRFAGDVFLLVLDDNKLHGELIDLIQQCFINSVQVTDAKRVVEVQVGLAKLPQDGVEVVEVMRNAEIALHSCKQKNHQPAFLWFNPEQLHALQALDELDRSLRTAIAQQQLTMVYQPIVEAKTRKLVSAEALVRWTHPVEGDIRPDIFIARAEQNGLIFSLGREIIQLVASDSRNFAKSNLGMVPLSINVSRAQFFDDGFSAFLNQQLTSQFAPAQVVSLEVTESFEFTDYAGLSAIIESVDYPALKWSLDDFGTGYSSYSAIGKLPIDNIKIDRSFIAHLEESTVNQSIVANIITMAHTLGKTVTAEGVETEGQCELLVMMQCDYLQGYLFDKPLAPNILIERYAGRT
ncbi:bifunctional diguanylate cyclase/phosphodiesterase [Salinibius halmophilus]|uniref:bifunctional diguanylate cyclase/phosphodiesterase n=1 Tax=Salinibius halmophilus TaxID=1853216 RepID=UPI000E66E972|nr:EAL domain-containing protein [Salinibius halmophilus]